MAIGKGRGNRNDRWLSIGRIWESEQNNKGKQGGELIVIAE